MSRLKVTAQRVIVKPHWRHRDAEITETEKWRIRLLGDSGWYSHRYIAKRVFGGGNPKYAVTDHDLNCVAAALYAEPKILVTAGRNGETDAAHNLADRLMHAKESKSSKLKLA